MRASLLKLAGGLAAVAVAALAAAQEGHPLKGSWIGVWDSNATHGDNIVVILDWDGSRITGMINPGTDNIEIDAATLNPENWTVRIEADAQTDDGDTITYVIEGMIEALELPSRSIIGTWRSDNGRGVFDIRRQ